VKDPAEFVEALRAQGFGTDQPVSGAGLVDWINANLPPVPEPSPSRWRCSCCGSLEVQVSLPTWYYESLSGELTFVETDSEADIKWWYCEACDATDDGEPERNTAS
jgi:hypothetical protein